MNLHLERFPNAQMNNAEWDDFVRSSANGTIFHLRKFLAYHPEGRFTDHSLLFTRKGKVQAIMPSVEWLIDKEKTLFSHRGASFGGLVYEECSIQDAIDWVQALKHYARQQNFRRIMLTLPPQQYNRTASNYLEFALVQAGFRYQKRELTAIVQLPMKINTTEEQADIFQLFKPEARTATRKARKMGVEIRASQDFAAYYEILSHNLMMRHNATPTHTLQELEYLAAAFPNNITLHAAYLEGRMIAGVVNFVANPRTVIAFYISDNKEFQEVRALNLLFYEIFAQYAQQGITWYDFGTFTLNMEPNLGLGRFKESFGAHGVFRDTLEILL